MHPAQGAATAHHLGLASVQLSASDWWRVEFGERLVVLAISANLGHSCSEMQLHALAAGNVVLQRTLTSEGRVFDTDVLKLSADGSMAAAILGIPKAVPDGRQMSQCHLALVHLVTGTMRAFPLYVPQLANISPFDRLQLLWSSDGSCVLVLCVDKQVCHREVFSLAAVGGSVQH